MNKLLVIVGPTASGKSDLAIQIAKQFNGEIISADSRQVYRGMDIGTGKVKIQIIDGKIYSDGIRHYLLDIADPKEYFSVAQYQPLAVEVIKQIQQQGKLPILCGGTGMYINAVIEGWQLPFNPPNPSFRNQLESLSSKELFLKLKQLDPQRAVTIDSNNKRRLIRALEILNHQTKITPLQKIPPPWDILILGIKKDRAQLKELIKLRLLKRLDEGMIEEIKKLKNPPEGQGLTSKRLEDFGLEYRWVNRYLEQQISYEKMVNSLYHDICLYAKRQMTWFNNKIFKIYPNSYWITSPQEAITLVSQWLQ